MRSPWRESRRRRVAWVALILAVLLAHVLVGWHVAANVIGWNASPRPTPLAVFYRERLLKAKGHQWQK